MTRLPLARRAIFEMIGVILLTPLLDILAGTVVEPRISRFQLFPALLAIIPPLVSERRSPRGNPLVPPVLQAPPGCAVRLERCPSPLPSSTRR